MYDDDEGPPPPPPSQGYDEQSNAIGNGGETEIEYSELGGIVGRWERILHPEESAYFYFNHDSGEYIWEEELREMQENAVDNDHNRENFDAMETIQWSSKNPSNNLGVEDPINEDDFDPQNLDMTDFLKSLDSIENSSQNNVASKSKMSVVERSTLMLMQKQEKIAALRQQQLLNEMAEIKSNPAISKKSQGIQKRSVEDMLQWEAQRKAKLEMKAKMLQQQRESELTLRPQVAKKSNQIMQMKKQREGQDDNYSVNSGNPLSPGSVGGGASVMTTSTTNKSVQERLYEYDEIRRLKLQRLQEQQLVEAKRAAKPQIDQHSARLMRGAGGGDESTVNDGATVVTANERLYAMAQYQQRQQAFMDQFLTDGRYHDHDPVTGQRLFEPKINKTSAQLARKDRRYNAPIEEVLQAKGEIYRRKMEMKELQQLHRESADRQLKKVNPVSERLVLEKELVTGERAEDRLKKPIGAVKSKTLDTIDQPTFRPKISDTSLEILAQSGVRYKYFNNIQQGQQNMMQQAGGGRGKEVFFADGSNDDDVVSLMPGNNFRDNHNNPNNQQSFYSTNDPNSMYERTIAWEQQRRKKQEDEKRKKDQELMQKCPFKPTVKPLNSGSNEDEDNFGNNIPIADRHKLWAQRRDERLAIERAKQDEEEIRDCTFTPNVQTAVPAASSSGVRGRSRSNVGQSIVSIRSNSNSDGKNNRSLSSHSNDASNVINKPVTAPSEVARQQYYFNNNNNQQSFDTSHDKGEDITDILLQPKFMQQKSSGEVRKIPLPVAFKPSTQSIPTSQGQGQGQAQKIQISTSIKPPQTQQQLLDPDEQHSSSNQLGVFPVDYYASDFDALEQMASFSLMNYSSNGNRNQSNGHNNQPSVGHTQGYGQGHGHGYQPQSSYQHHYQPQNNHQNHQHHQPHHQNKAQQPRQYYHPTELLDCDDFSMSQAMELDFDN